VEQQAGGLENKAGGRGPGLIVQRHWNAGSQRAGECKRDRRCRSAASFMSRLPDNAWAMDARDGPRKLWHYVWKTARRHPTSAIRGPPPCGHNRLYMETPDDVLIWQSTPRPARKIWHKDIADFDLQYFSTPRADRHRQSYSGSGRATTSNMARIPAVVRSRDGATCSGSSIRLTDEEGRPPA